MRTIPVLMSGPRHPASGFFPNGSGSSVYYRYAQNNYLAGYDGDKITINNKEYNKPFNISQINCPAELMVMMDAGGEKTKDTAGNHKIDYTGNNFDNILLCIL